MKIRITPYFGGKFRMLEKLLMLTPDCKKWYELFGGSCALTLNHMRHIQETVNEKDKNMYELLEVIRDDKQCKEFIEKLWELEYSEDVFNKAKEELNKRGKS